MRERDFERKVVRSVREQGGTAIKLMGAVVGLPDRLVILPGGRIWFVELKTPRGRRTEVQKHWGRKLLKLGCNYLCVDNLAHFEAVVFGRSGVDEFDENALSVNQ